MLHGLAQGLLGNEKLLGRYWVALVYRQLKKVVNLLVIHDVYSQFLL